MVYLQYIYVQIRICTSRSRPADGVVCLIRISTPPAHRMSSPAYNWPHPIQRAAARPYWPGLGIDRFTFGLTLVSWVKVWCVPRRYPNLQPR